MKLKNCKQISLISITGIPFLIFGFYYMWKYSWLLEEYEVLEESGSSPRANFTLSVELSHTYRFTTNIWGDPKTQDEVSTTFKIFIDGVKLVEVYQVAIINYDDEGNVEIFDS